MTSSGREGAEVGGTSLDERGRRLRDERNLAADLERSEREREHLAAQLLEAEQELARIPVLERRIDELKADFVSERALLGQEADDLRARLAHAEAVIAGMQHSASWRVTWPLRAFKRLGRRISRRGA